MATARLIGGDCRMVMAAMDAASVDAVVTDPPYGLAFMGKAWDTFGAEKRDTTAERDAGYRHDGKGAQPYGYSHGKGADAAENRRAQSWHESWLVEAFRVLKPGAPLLAFGGTRTWHRLACAVEDAGFQIVDTLMWLHGQGMPKHKTLLKPAWEPIVVAKKPGAGGLRIEACRIGTGDETGRQRNTALGIMNDDGWQPTPAFYEGSPSGRWPANVALSHTPDCREVGVRRVKGSNGIRGRGGSVYGGGKGYTADFAELGQAVGYADPDGTETVAAWECAPDCAVRMLDEQSGERASGGVTGGAVYRHPQPSGFMTDGRRSDEHTTYGDTGGASRFFYCAKASRRERGEGNTHPTVKPLALMRWLVRLATPPSGLLLDPFCGSGSTLIAAVREGFDCVGIDGDPESIATARRRLLADAPLFDTIAGTVIPEVAD